MAELYIVYHGDNQTWFDREYYSVHHLPLVRACWSPYGLLSASVYYPEDEGGGTIAICVCVFVDEQAIQRSLSAACTPEVMEDVIRFTGVTPVRFEPRPLT